MIKFLTEGIGTCILVITIGLTTDPIAAGLILVALLYVGFSITEVHYNPAVTLGSWTIGSISNFGMIIRLAGQFSGAIVGAFLVSWITLIGYIPRPAGSTGMAEFILLEILFSGLFVLLFLYMIYPSTQRKRTFSGLIIGATFTGCLLVMESAIGFGMHPALNSAFSFVDYLHGGNSYLHLPIYFFAPLVAALIAALIFKRVPAIHS